jgi:histidine triad (HIT) family protein
MSADILIRPLEATDAQAYHPLRERALREHPEAFGRTDGEIDPVEAWGRRLAAHRDSNLEVIIGAFRHDRLIGTVGCYREPWRKLRHIGHIWGLYVAPEHRRDGVARRLMLAVVDHVRGWADLDAVTLDVTTVNISARALYRTLGFRTVGIKPRSLKHAGRYYDEEQMMLDLTPAPASGDGDRRGTEDFYCEEALSGRTPIEVVAETDDVLAFHHTRPFWPVHIVVVPKRHVPSLTTLGDADERTLHAVLDVVRRVADDVTERHGACRVLTNLGRYQDSKHLHFHVCSGEPLR